MKADIRFISQLDPEALATEIALSELRRGQSAVVIRVDDQADGDLVAGRLRRIGFAPGERVCLRHVGPMGREPLLFQVGTTRFALRQAEAQRVIVTAEVSA